MKPIWVWFDFAFYCLLPHRNSGLILALLHAESQGLISALHWLGRTRVLSVVPQAQLRLDQQPEIPTASCLPSSEHGCSLAFSICCSVGVSQACSAVWFVPMGRCPWAGSDRGLSPALLQLTLNRRGKQRGRTYPCSQRKEAGWGQTLQPVAVVAFPEDWIPGPHCLFRLSFLPGVISTVLSPTCTSDYAL